MRFVVGTRGKIERVRVAALPAVAERDAPEAIDHDRFAALIFELTNVLSACEIVRVQLAVAEVADDERIAERTEVFRRMCESPGCLEVIAFNQSLFQVAARVEYVQVAIPAVVRDDFCEQRPVRLGRLDGDRQAILRTDPVPGGLSPATVASVHKARGRSIECRFATAARQEDGDDDREKD